MKLVLKDKKHGVIKLVIDENEDYYYLDKLVNAGDWIKAISHRKVKKGEKEETVKKKYLITIKVEEASFENRGIRFKGKITGSNSEDVPLGSYHSISVEEGCKLTILKKISKTDEDILEKACKSRKSRTLLSVVDYGESRFGILEKNRIRKLGSYEENINEREVRRTEENQDKYLKEYVKKLEEIDKQENPNIIIIGSPGFVSDHLKKVLTEKLKRKTRFCKVSTTTQNGLQEILNRGETEKIVREEEVSKETRLLEEFFARISKKNPKTAYGLKQVGEKALAGAVEKLIVSDAHLKDERFRGIIDLVESFGGKTEIISSQHDKGEEFLKFGGVGAFLRY